MIDEGLKRLRVLELANAAEETPRMLAQNVIGMAETHHEERRKKPPDKRTQQRARALSLVLPGVETKPMSK